MDLNKALDGCDDKHATILLAHQPKAAKYALDTNYDIQLVLAGKVKTKSLAFSIIYGNLYFSNLFSAKNYYREVNTYKHLKEILVM